MNGAANQPRRFLLPIRISMKRILLIVALICSASFACAQTPGRIMTVTRSVARFSELENRLDDALRAHDDAALARLVAANFEARAATAPGKPMPRVDWLARPAPPKAEISQMAVHDYADVSVVSFLDSAQRAIVVDVWTRVADDYALSVRYTGAANGAPQTQPENPAK